jgi:hypothetical protein
VNVTTPCPCPPKADGTARHESDTVTLRDKLDFRQATAIRNAIAYAKLDDPDIDGTEILAILTEGYILQGVEAWSFVEIGEKGKVQPRPVTKPAIRDALLSDAVFAQPIGEAADALYGPMILLPLVQRALASSQPSQTDESTSQKTTSPPKRPKRLKPSSISTTATDGTATITSLPGGVSSSSPSSATAA